MNAKQQMSSAVATAVVLAVIAMVSWWYHSQHPVAGPGSGSGDVTVSVTSPDDLGPGSLREALFVAASARGRASVRLVTRSVTLKTALPPLMNPHGLELVAEPPGAEIDAQALTGGAVLDVVGPNTSIEGVIVRHCRGAAVLLRAPHFHMHASVLEGCEVGVEVAANAADVLLDDNRFAHDKIGVRFGAANTNTAVVNNTFAHATEAGLWAVSGDRDTPPGGDAIHIRDNHFTDNHAGVVAGNVPIVIEHNNFSGNAPEAAVHLIGAGAAIRNNHVVGPAKFGIVAEFAHGAVIEGNELSGLSSYAVMLRSSAGASVRANRIAGCASGLALVLGDPEHPSKAVGNIISDPKLNAIDVIGDSPILTDNQVVRPHALALRVTDYTEPGGQSVRAHPALQGNNFRANTVGTIPVEPATAAVGRP